MAGNPGCRFALGMQQHTSHSVDLSTDFLVHMLLHEFHTGKGDVAMQLHIERLRVCPNSPSECQADLDALAPAG